jgi:hypothetical protein
VLGPPLPPEVGTALYACKMLEGALPPPQWALLARQYATWK